MRCVIQRVLNASVEVEGACVGAIGPGLLVLAGLEREDGEREMLWMAEKVCTLRIFEDDAGKMNRSVLDVSGGVLIVPNFTVAGDAQKGRRPSFDGAMRPELAGPMFDRFVMLCREQGVQVATGMFRAQMRVMLCNDGPITIVVESRAGK